MFKDCICCKFAVLLNGEEEDDDGGGNGKVLAFIAVENDGAAAGGGGGGGGSILTLSCVRYTPASDVADNLREIRRCVVAKDESNSSLLSILTSSYRVVESALPSLLLVMIFLFFIFVALTLRFFIVFFCFIL